ncbi:MAG: ParB N-terminal domain-containing protein [Acetobacteraceae bacterium]
MSVTPDALSLIAKALTVSLDSLFAGITARTVKPDAAADQALRDSIRAQGVLEPILCRPRRNGLIEGEAPGIPVHGNALEIVHGRRRVEAARAEGLTDIAVVVREMTDAEALAVALSANLQRDSIHPVDQWRQVRALVDAGGITLAEAARRLGMDQRKMRLMERLGRLEQPILDLCVIEMPSEYYMRTIALAPPDVQRKAAEGNLVNEYADERQVRWDAIAGRCKVERCYKTDAIFDAEASDIAWEEDLLAEPGSRAQFSTPDVEGFVARQKTAAEEKVAALKKRARLVELDRRGQIAVPAGAEALYYGTGTAIEAPKRGQTLLVAVGADGRIQTAVIAEGKPGAGKDDILADDGHDDNSHDERRDGPVAPTPAPSPGVTQDGLGLIAAAKTEALRTALLEQPLDAHDLARMLLLTLCADNVDVRTTGQFRVKTDLPPRLVAPGGTLLSLTDEEVNQIARETLAEIIRFAGPKGSQMSASGAAGEWIGAAVNAQESLGRFDTAEFLATCKGEELKRAAFGTGFKANQPATALKRELEGKSPNWRPEAAQFGAPGPRARNSDNG